MKKHLLPFIKFPSGGFRKFFLFLLLCGTGGFAFAQSHINIALTGTTYTETPAVKFRVSWSSIPQDGKTRHSKIWVMVDYRKVEHTQTTGSWTRATVAGVSPGTVAAGGKGFWLQGDTGAYNQEVTVRLSGMPDRFVWSVHVSDYPPSATVKAGGGYDLHGTPLFTVNGEKLGDGVKTFGAGTCITSISDATDNPEWIIPAPPAATANPAARCGNGEVILTATASGGTTSANTYTWKIGTAGAITTTANTYSHMVNTGSTTYSVTITNANNCTGAAATGTITVHPVFSAGAITTATVSTKAGIAPATDPANATDASGGDGSITYEWRRTGTSSKILANSNSSGYTLSSDASNYSTDGTYYFTRYAKDGACNTAFTASSGQYTLTVTTPTPPPGSGTFTWTCGSQTWSGLLRSAAGCSSKASLSKSLPPPAQYKDNGDTYGYYYNWTCVKDYATTLCPSPWRVPTKTDFDNLVSCTNSSTLISAWGLPGYVYGGTMYRVGEYGYYWSSTEEGGANAYELRYGTTDLGVHPNTKSLGQQVRCVR